MGKALQVVFDGAPAMLVLIICFQASPVTGEVDINAIMLIS